MPVVVPTPTWAADVDDGVPVSKYHDVTVSATDASYFCTGATANPASCEAANCAAIPEGSTSPYGRVDSAGSMTVRLDAGSAIWVLPCDANDQPSLNVWTTGNELNYDTGAVSFSLSPLQPSCLCACRDFLLRIVRCPLNVASCLCGCNGIRSRTDCEACVC